LISTFNALEPESWSALAAFWTQAYGFTPSTEQMITWVTPSAFSFAIAQEAFLASGQQQQQTAAFGGGGGGAAAGGLGGSGGFGGASVPEDSTSAQFVETKSLREDDADENMSIGTADTDNYTSGDRGDRYGGGDSGGRMVKVGDGWVFQRT
jgi:hypothetical protein